MRKEGALRWRAWVLALGMYPIGWAAPASAQVRMGPAERISAAADPNAEALGARKSLRNRFGIEVARRLVDSADAEERIRGIQRARDVGTPEAVALLASLTESGSPLKSDGLGRLELGRALAHFGHQAAGREALSRLLNWPVATSSRSTADEHWVEATRVVAALGLARARDARATEVLLVTARGTSPGRAAAVEALSAHPPEAPGPMAPPGHSAGFALASELGDLRMLEATRMALRASDVDLRSAAIVTLAEFGDFRVLEAARAGLTDPEPRMRIAAAMALTRLGAPEAARAVEALLGDASTVDAGLELAESTSDEGVVRALAARAVASSDSSLRLMAIRALGTSLAPSAIQALVALVRDPVCAGEVGQALGRSPSPDASRAIEQLAASDGTQRLAIRAYLVRAYVRGEKNAHLEDLLSSAETSRDPTRRALAFFGATLLHGRSPRAGLRDDDPRVRIATALATLSQARDDWRAELVSARQAESNAEVRMVLAIGLMTEKTIDQVTTSELLERARSGEADAPLASREVLRRAREVVPRELQPLLDSPEPALRAQALRGLASSAVLDAAGRLATRYRTELDVFVRRAIVESLAALARSADSPAGRTVSPATREALTLAAELDPDARIRASANRALARQAPLGAPKPSELAWLRAMEPSGLPPGRRMTGLLVRSDGWAVPFAFDDDGYVLVPVPPGPTRVVLAPWAASYEPSRR